ncbi:MAG: NAD(P)H-dependent oxidoreductase [Wenzhouxiangella sp.]|jgi:NAD(P)H-dependent FMN reductase|nr:NAD(P)H-dependent oxidoreductase [Wenzhouxiangella sp.]
MQWIAISGSLRKNSFNTRLAHLIADRAPKEVRVDVRTLHGVPLYDADLEESSGIPEAVESLRSRIKVADGLIIVSPEYNAAMPGVLKNALDWLTRPGEEMKPTFGGRPTGLVGATPGAWGTAFAQAGALINLRQLGCHLHPGYLRVSGAGDLFGDDGPVDEGLAKQVDRWIEGFRAFIR